MPAFTSTISSRRNISTACATARWTAVGSALSALIAKPLRVKTLPSMTPQAFQRWGHCFARIHTQAGDEQVSLGHLSVLPSTLRCGSEAFAYVFTNSGKSPVGGWSMIKNRLDAAMGNPTAWRFHDLRRTFVTGLADLGIRPDVIELAANHRSGLRGASPASTIKASCCPSGERRWSAGRRASKASWPGSPRRWCLCPRCKSEGSATCAAKRRRACRGEQ
jgi:hypothetical protein